MKIFALLAALLLAPLATLHAADGSGALAFYLMFETTGEQRYRKTAVSMTDQILKDMRATKFGVLPIKEKEKADGKTIIGGGPLALGAYASAAAYILHKEGGRNDDLKYIATVLDRYPWNEEGWWASTIDVATGEPKVPITNEGIINKSAAVAMAAGMVSAFVADVDPELHRLSKNSRLDRGGREREVEWAGRLGSESFFSNTRRVDLRAVSSGAVRRLSGIAQ